jgi:hypothetical protein
MDEKIATLEILLEESQHENKRLSEELLDIRDLEIERTLSAELSGINEQNQDNFEIVEQGSFLSFPSLSNIFKNWTTFCRKNSEKS